MNLPDTPSPLISDDRDPPAFDSDEFYAEVADALQVTGVALTVAQARQLLAGHAELLSQIDDWGVDDTEVLNQLACRLAVELIGEHWPTYGDERNGRDFRAFEASLRGAALARGYALLDASVED
ncbi:hypothetical protein [Stenotrophomonas maltophilia]|uniref:hypothetical protein n=1 Tax=Stenotrophomonas maltophilia TaxID=40324 RepID=UPI0013DADFBF|nr:hypothetical protein [Stenotrophomonas maltophilia]